MKRTDAGQASDLVAQVFAPSFTRHGGFESSSLGPSLAVVQLP